MSAPEPVLFVETSRDLPLVSFTCATRTGAIEDPENLEGVSRMAARLMRRTAGGLAPREVDERIDALGGSVSVDVGHSTSAFNATVIKRSLDGLLAVVADVLTRPGFAAAEHERLKRETEGEIIDARDSDHALARRFFRRRLFGAHPYGRPVGGTIQSVKNIELAAISEVYAKTITSSNLAFAFAGDIDESEARLCVRRLTGGLDAGAPRADTVPDPNLPKGRRLVIVDKPDRTQTQILMGTLGTHPCDADHTALHVANTIFGGTFTARMTQEVRAKRGWSYGAYSSLPIDRRRQGFSMWTFPKSGDAGACIALQLEMLESWRDEGVTRIELDWAKSYLVKSHAFAIDTASKRVSLELEASLYDLPDRYHEDYLDRVRDVTLDEANEAVRRRISVDDLLVTIVGTENDIGERARAAIPDLASAEVVPFDAD